MIFTEGKCPKCHGMIQIPSNYEIIHCMYCGEEIKTMEALEAVKNDTIVKIMDKDEYEEEIKEVLEALPEMLNYKEGMEQFKKDTYKEAFETYYNRHFKTYMAIDRLFSASEDKELFIRKLVNQLVETEKMQLSSAKKSEHEKILIDDNLKLTVYLLPAMLKYKGEAMNQLTDGIVEGWRATFPKYQISKANFEKINSGFKSKLCYITTAVCESLGKDDDCYELNVLRRAIPIHVIAPESISVIIVMIFTKRFTNNIFLHVLVC